MKTTAHLHRAVATPVPHPGRSSTIRLGVIVSVVAALAAVVIHVTTDIPTAVILVPVVVIGFALSWHATGERHDSAPRR